MHSSRSRRILPAVAVGVLALAACGSDDDTTSEEVAPVEAAAGDCAVDSLSLFADGQLTIATGEPVFPPWMLDDDPTSGEGFESAIAYALADEMGFENDAVQWVRTDFDVAIAPGDKDYDFNMQQYSPTAERDEVVDFSMPYYTASKSVLALNSSPAATATDFAGLADATWGATIGTTDLDYLENEIGADDVAVFDTQSDVVAAMLAGQIDATVVTLPTAFFLNAVELDDSTIVGVLPAIGANDVSDDMALLFTDGNPLVDCVDRALTSLADSGELDAIAEEWLQGANDIPNITK